MAKPLVCHRCGFIPSGPALHCPTDGLRLVPAEEHEKAPHDPYLGRMLGERYALVGLLGEGAMGAVYLARQMPLDREVAIKVIRPMALSGSTKSREQMAQRFLREAQLQADFNHHAVVTVLDFGAEPDGTLFMVMERLQGVPLSHFLAEGVEARVLVGMVLQLLDALGRFHDRGLIHRDIKPDNLMVLDGPPTADGMPRVKLLDFGIAKSIRDQTNTKLTQDGTIFGTPEYMAPEQALGIPEDVDHRCDLYAVGTVLYEGLTGQPPFTGNSPLAILHRVVSGVVPPLPESVSPALAAVVMKALAKGRDARYADAKAMAEALAQTAGLIRDRSTVSGRNRPTPQAGALRAGSGPSIGASPEPPPREGPRTGQDAADQGTLTPEGTLPQTSPEPRARRTGESRPNGRVPGQSGQGDPASQDGPASQNGQPARGTDRESGPASQNAPASQNGPPGARGTDRESGPASQNAPASQNGPPGARGTDRQNDSASQNGPPGARGTDRQSDPASPGAPAAQTRPPARGTSPPARNSLSARHSKTTAAVSPQTVGRLSESNRRGEQTAGHDPRDVFSVSDSSESDLAGRVRRRRRRRMWSLAALLLLAAGGVAGWQVLKPFGPVRPPLNTEPVRVQVNARFETDAPATPSNPPPPK